MTIKWVRAKSSCNNCEHFENEYLNEHCSLGIEIEVIPQFYYTVSAKPVCPKGCRAARQNAQFERIRSRQLSGRICKS